MGQAAELTGLPGYDDALSRILAQVPARATEQVPISQARGRVLRQGIKADRDQPPFNRSAMDGFAVRSAEIKAGGVYKVIGTVPAGSAPDPMLNQSAGVVRIATGAAVPDAYDAVIPIEQAEVRSDSSIEQVHFLFDGVSPWKNIHRRGSDAVAGTVVLAEGTCIKSQHIGIAAAVGASSVTVTTLPDISLLTSGDEVRDPETATGDLSAQQIRNSNGPMLQSLLESWGVPLLEQMHLPDEAEPTLLAARESLARSDLVLTVGGVSVGQRDLLTVTWEKLGLLTVLHGVAIQPGKPLLVARQGRRIDDQVHDRTRVVLGLPGNPVSVLAIAYLFLWPVLRKMLGVVPRHLPWQIVTIAAPTHPSAKRQVFRAARFVGNGQREVELIPWQGSGDLVHTATAEGLVRLPIQSEPVPAGAELPLLPFV